MKVRVDADRCVGHVLCYSRAPEVFADDEEGYSHVRLEGELPAGRQRSRRWLTSLTLLTRSRPCRLTMIRVTEL
jgi:ferredoxin